MKNFIARLIFRVNVDDKTISFDEQVHLLRCNDMEEAMLLLHAKGLEESSVSCNDAGRKVAWEFTGIRDLCSIPLNTGESLLFSNTIVPEDAEAFATYIQQKSLALHENLLREEEEK